MLHKRGFWELIYINFPYFFLVNMINWWGVYSDRLKKRGLRHGSGKKGGLRHGSGPGGGGGVYSPHLMVGGGGGVWPEKNIEG